MSVISGEGNLFKQESWTGSHNLLMDTLKMAIYKASVDMGPDTDSYITDGEIVDGSYPPGGNVITNPVISQDGNTTVFSFDPVEFEGVTAEFDTVMIYNSSKLDRMVMIVNMGRVIQPAVNGFTISPEPANAHTGLLTAI